MQLCSKTRISFDTDLYVTMLGLLAVGLGGLMVGFGIWEGGSKVGKAAESAAAQFKDNLVPRIFRFLKVTVLGLLSAGLVVVLGVVMAGFGILKGGYKVGEAAESTADHAGRALDAISNDVNELKTNFIREIGLNVTATLVRFQEVLGRADELIITWTFATKFVALLAWLSAVLVCKKIASENSNTRRGRNRLVLVTLEELILQFLYWTFMLMVLVLAVHLVGETCQIAWPRNIPLIFIIPSMTTLGLCLQHLVAIFKAIWKFTMRITYWIFGLPFDLFRRPASTGYTYYANSSILLSTIVCTIVLPLYSFALFFLMTFFESFLKRRKISPFQTVLASYVIFVVTALVVCGIWAFFHRFFIRPAWAFSAKRNYRTR